MMDIISQPGCVMGALVIDDVFAFRIRCTDIVVFASGEPAHATTMGLDVTAVLTCMLNAKEVNRPGNDPEQGNLMLKVPGSTEKPPFPVNSMADLMELPADTESTEFHWMSFGNPVKGTACVLGDNNEKSSTVLEVVSSLGKQSRFSTL